MDGGMGEWVEGWTKGTARGGRKAKKLGRVGVDRLPFMLVVESPIFFASIFVLMQRVENTKMC